MVKVHGSRRAASLQPGDYDHEIVLIDDEEDQLRSVPTASLEGSNLETTTTLSRLLPSNQPGGAFSVGNGDLNDEEEEEEENHDGWEGDEQHLRAEEMQQDEVTSRGATRLTCGNAPSGLPEERTARPPTDIPSIEQAENGLAYHIVTRRRPKKKRETAIDILYENERGGFLCGIALFSGAALGGLDPTPWTNGYHKASPTNIHNAQCPDPSWEWVWPEWRIYRQEGTGEDGWEYSFHFSKRFSWHKPRWYNSFVRRRAWIRRRAKRRPEDIPTDYHMLNNDYFSVIAASDRELRSHGSVTSSHPSTMSFMHAPTAETEEDKMMIEDIDMLLHILRLCRIDREKREAVENYLEHAIDLAALQHEMHEIMSLFVFQASRRQLLGHFMQKYDETVHQLSQEESLEMKLQKEALEAAIKHAEEEICKLAYWSDVKQMAENGELMTSGGGHNAWQGLDRSSPCPPIAGEMAPLPEERL